MMALTTHQLQGSCSSIPSVPSSLSRGSNLKHLSPSLLSVGRKDRFISLKCRSYSSVVASHSLGPRSKSLKISAFKGRHDDSCIRTSLKNPPPLQVSYLQHESEESSSCVESSKVHNDESTNNTTISSRSLIMQNLFKNWLVLLRTPSQTVNDEVVEETTKSSEIQHAKPNQERGEVLKAVLLYFMGLDATIMIPILIFTPLYLAVYFIYGSEVSKELTPLWILGPLIVALYVKIFRAICGLYVFTFMRTVELVKNLPAYYSLARDYYVNGKIKEAIQTHIWKPIDDIKNMDYKKWTIRKLKVFQEWLVERYLDFVESIWPYYCRIIRFLKTANLL